MSQRLHMPENRAALPRSSQRGHDYIRCWLLISYPVSPLIRRCAPSMLYACMLHAPCSMIHAPCSMLHAFNLYQEPPCSRPSCWTSLLSTCTFGRLGLSASHTKACLCYHAIICPEPAITDIFYMHDLVSHSPTYQCIVPPGASPQGDYDDKRHLVILSE
jgi:hypothetical protein